MAAAPCLNLAAIAGEGRAHSRQAAYSPDSFKRVVLYRKTNQDTLIEPVSLTTPHRAPRYFEAAFAKAVDWVSLLLQRLHGEKKGGTTGVAGVVHFDPETGKKILSYMTLADSKLCAIAKPKVGAEARVLFETREHTPMSEAEPLGSYFLVQANVADARMAEICSNAASSDEECRAILNKVTLPRRDRDGDYVFNLNDLSPSERRVFFTRIIPCVEDFNVRSREHFKVYCLNESYSKESAIAPSRSIGDFALGSAIIRRPEVGHIELPSDEDVWVLAMTDGVSEPFKTETIQMHLLKALEREVNPAQYICEMAENAWFKRYPKEYSDDISLSMIHLAADAPLSDPRIVGAFDGHGNAGEIFSTWAAHAFSILVPAFALIAAEKRRLTSQECKEIALALTLSTDPGGAAALIEEMLLAESELILPEMTIAEEIAGFLPPGLWRTTLQAAASMPAVPPAPPSSH